jgi:hypothetical protein
MLCNVLADANAHDGIFVDVRPLLDSLFERTCRGDE